MKKLLTLLFLCISAACPAQDVTIKKDVIYKDDVPYAHIFKSGSILHDFSITTLDGDEILAAVHQGDGTQYLITFMGSGARGMMRGDFAFSKKLAKELVISNIIKDGKLNPAGERRFLLLHPATDTAPVAEASADARPVVTGDDEQPERLRTAPVMVFGSNISQDNVTIGSYKTRSTAANGTVYKLVTIYSPGRKKIAEATFEGAGATSGRIVTMKDNKAASISVDSFDDMGMAKEAAAWLVARYYL